MLGWTGNIEELTVGNTNFRTVIYTGVHTQLTLMSVEVGDEVGWERHGHLDQFLRIEEGSARLDLSTTEQRVEESHTIEADWALIVPAGLWNNVVNTGDGLLKLYSLYSPPEHPEGTVHVTSSDDPHHQ
jgi:mannose-6-phosphate isomerase-like protein (cupin superfamily)